MLGGGSAAPILPTAASIDRRRSARLLLRRLPAAARAALPACLPACSGNGCSIPCRFRGFGAAPPACPCPCGSGTGCSPCLWRGARPWMGPTAPAGRALFECCCCWGGGGGRATRLMAWMDAEASAARVGGQGGGSILAGCCGSGCGVAAPPAAPPPTWNRASWASGRRMASLTPGPAGSRMPRVRATAQAAQAGRRDSERQA